MFGLPEGIRSRLKDAVLVSQGIHSNSYEGWMDVYSGSAGIFVVHMQPSNMRARIMKVPPEYSAGTALVYASQHENEFSYWFYAL